MANNKIILINSFKGGLARDQYEPLSRGTFQNAQDLEIFTPSNVLSPHLALGADTTDKTRNNIKLNSSIKGKDGNIYFRGFDESAGTTLTIWDAGASLGSATALTAETTASGNSSSFGMVEFLANLFYYDTSTTIQRFNFTSVTTSATSVNNTCPLFVHEGLLKMFYTVDTYKIGYTTTTSIDATTRLTFGNDILPKMMAPLGQFVVVGINNVSNAKTSKLAIWDGNATTIDDLIDIGDTGLQGIYNINGAIYILTSSNSTGSSWVKTCIVRLYRWAGGQVQLLKELDLKPTSGTGVTINPAAITAHKDTLYFGMNALTANTMTIPNGVYAYNARTGILTLDRVVEDTSNINITSISIIEGQPVVTWTDGTNYRINHVGVSNSKSALGIFETNVFPIGFQGKIKSILIHHKPLPTSCGFTVSIKHYGHYPLGTTVPSEDSYTAFTTTNGAPQGSGNPITGGETQSTDYTTYTYIESPNVFKKSNFVQLKIEFDEISGITSPEIIFPIVITLE